MPNKNFFSINDLQKLNNCGESNVITINNEVKLLAYRMNCTYFIRQFDYKHKNVNHLEIKVDSDLLNKDDDTNVLLKLCQTNFIERYLNSNCYQYDDSIRNFRGINKCDACKKAKLSCQS